jgi:predicted membrane chloride channel (bestrophin family)
LQSIVNSVRNLVRSFLVCGPLEDDADRAETEKTVKALVAMLYAVKNHLRGNWDAIRSEPEYASLIPEGFHGHEAEGVGLALELAFVVERYIKRVCIFTVVIGLNEVIINKWLDDGLTEWGSRVCLREHSTHHSRQT